MQIVPASDALSDAIKGLLIAQMARALILRGADLACDVSVIHALATAGFGPATIRDLHRRAARAARTSRQAVSRRVH